MSTALAKLERHETRPKQHPAGIGATLAYNDIVFGVLPPIIAELEHKIAALEEKINRLASQQGRQDREGH